MRRKPIASEALVSIGYDARRQVLEVEFDGGDVYRYRDVPIEVYETLLAAESKGTWFNQTFKSLGLEYEQVN
ncbi:KTSC domain-containing protein [Pseudomonas sp. Marseille-QA0892]